LGFQAVVWNMNDLRFALRQWWKTIALVFISANAHSGTNQLDAVQLFKAGKLNEARQAFEGMAKMNAQDAEARCYLGQIELKAIHYDKAVKWLEQTAALSRTNIEHLLWLARAYGRLASKEGVPFGAGPARKCKATLDKILALAPEDLRARHGLIEFHLEAPAIAGGSLKEAYRQAEEIRKRDSYEGLVALADLYSAEKKFDDATQALECAIKELDSKPLDGMPSRAAVYVRLGNLYEKRRQRQQAKTAYEQALKLDGRNKEAANALRRLKEVR
jgi:tetratricopeptide (TPR) repeat protein